MEQARRRRSQMVAVGSAAMLLTSLTGCGSSSSSDDETRDAAGVCVDRDTQVRVDDSECDDHRHSTHHGWYFIPVGRPFPAIGSRASGGSWQASGKAVKGGMNGDGGTVTRGGFRAGGSGGGHGGGGHVGGGHGGGHVGG